MAWIFAAIAVIAVLGLLVVTLSKLNSQSHQENHQQLKSQPAEQDGTTKPQAYADAQNQTECGTSDNEQHNYWERFICYVETRDKFFTAFGTLIIAGFTVCLAFATVFLYFATKTLVESADQNAEKQLRAYVFVQGGFIGITPDGGGFVAHITIKNFGQTPALDFSTWLGGGVYDFNDVPFPNEIKPLSQRVNRSIVGPSADIQINTDSALLGDLVAIRNKNRAIFVWGGVDYADAFGHPRRLIVRTRMAGPEHDLGNGIRGWPLTPHPLGYEAN
jgi:hypothetical protein